MLDFIAKNWDSILFVLVFIVFMLFLLRRGQVKKVKKTLLWLVSEAEREFGNGTGELKFSAVSAWLYERLPTIAKIIITEKQIDDLIDESVQKMKDYLEKNEKAKLLILPPEDALD